jgi:hypothetical protein
LPFKGQLSAPAGSIEITPLTTLLVGLQSDPSAQQRVLAALGLSLSLNLTTLDPIAATKGGDAAAAAAYVAGAKIYDTVEITGTALSGVGVSFSKAYADTFVALDTAINALPAGQTLNVADKATITSLIGSISQAENVNLTSAATVAAAIAGSNAELDHALAQDGAGPTLFTDVAADQKLVLAALTASGTTVSGTEGAAISGATVATFTDANPNATVRDFTATINWGDGTITTGTVVAQSTGGFAVNGAHTYADEGKYKIGVTINAASTTSDANIADAALTASGTTVSGTEGAAISGAKVATFTDANPNATASDFTATINWGDGSSTTGTVVAQNGGGFAVDGTHTYADEGKYKIGVSIKERAAARQAPTALRRWPMLMC